ncbi:Protein SUPPRESSOR OF like [Actinidia chinensis var. chinensis]|uniref:Protein SUPPRESSOR OF like n=1 Tax=Actinidia chinensis var. chinensis TaxID=1590841 RepID=A0A2R6QI44_ACTCC|nr:Protein SUPPRESSOR OF like [Actinidia chinensis var. chinensis]
MRGGLNTIQQTLTPEAANVLNLSIAEAGRRSHGQTTPLHVAATLLQSPSGFLRQACIRSHPNSSHPLQCRALELCFSVALERLPTTTTAGSAAAEPPVSNALMAALKRAQAHQRRGCPEQQQQPLLAVKVELEQLIISILDDPSVSRVMREASFSSPAVKGTIEQSLNSQPQTCNSAPIGIGFRPNSAISPIPSRNVYLNPWLGNPGQQRSEEVKRVVDILLRGKKRNPVLVGQSEAEAVMREVLRRIEKEEFAEGTLKNVKVISIEREMGSDKAQIPTKIKELGGLIEAKMGISGGVLDLGDLKWLVEMLAVTSSGGAETGRAAVAEMGKLVARFEDGEAGGGRLWLIGTATCETYLRCQVYHPSMENDWDLQAVPIASKSPLPGVFPRFGTNGILSSSVVSLNPLKSFPTPTISLQRHVSEKSDPARRISCCPQCTESYEQELAKLVAKEYEKSSSEVKQEAAQPSLPQWLQNAKVLISDTKTQAKDQEMIFKKKSLELQKKWSDMCVNLHPIFHQNLSSERTPISLSMTSLYNPNLLLIRQNFQRKLQQPKNLGETLQLNSNQVANKPSEQACSPPASPVRTDLVLGRPKIGENPRGKACEDCVKGLLGCVSFEPQPKSDKLLIQKFSNADDADLFKKLLKGLTDKVWWQWEAASAVATAVSQCRLGNGKRQGSMGAKGGDIWLLFVGPDRVGKKKMASVLSEQFCGTNPMRICLGSRRDDEESDMKFRGKTVLDQITEAVRRNPFKVIMLEDIDEADMLVRESIKRAMERGRFADSHGREISLGNVIFILTVNGSHDNLKNLAGTHLLDEKKLASIASGDWQLRLSVREKSAKRRANWLHDYEERPTRPRKEIGSGLSFDLNRAADVEDYRTDGSYNSSDVTIDHEGDHGLEIRRFSITSVPHELMSSVNDAIIFKSVQIGPIRDKIKGAITEKFSTLLDDKLSIGLEEEALEKILAGLWLGRTSLQEWAEKVLVPSFQHLKTRLPSTSSDETVVVRLESDCDSGNRSTGDWLPSQITVKVDGV